MPELWGGVECTVNRVGDRFYDQTVASGHERRPEDIDRFAALGITSLRYPVLWERTAPAGLASARWGWADERLRRIRDAGMEPIVGLVHHGSGPEGTSLLDPAFPEKLAAYARAVAERYPWVRAFTPVNEPLTTARFSALYGFWYPHRKNGLAFARALLGQLRATVLAMRAIREVIPEARLVQTEDFGRTHSTTLLDYQAAFENERRWLTFDLLTGRLAPRDRMWRYFRNVGIANAELDWFRQHPCPPDVIGVNHYLSSERFLDHRIRRYPRERWGGNGRHRYADVEAVRVLAEGAAGPRALLREVWDRYALPLAVTEAHNGCTRDEQLRWFVEVWDAATALRASGVDLRAVTAWALLGSHDWNSLLTEPRGHYEPGVFDVRGPEPRPTAMAHVLPRLRAGQRPDHPALDEPGWWHRPERFVYGAPEVTPRRPGQAHSSAHRASGALRAVTDGSRRLLVFGAAGTLGRAFVRLCALRGLPVRSLTRSDADIADRDAVARVVERYEPWAIINAAGFVRVDDAEREAERCARENRDGPAVLAAAAAGAGIPLVTYSSDLVFDGAKEAAYVESDEPAPLNVYGRTKAEGERAVLERHPGALIIRTSAFFGPWDEHNFVAGVLRSLRSGHCALAAEDVVVTPTYVPDLVNASLDLLIDGERGIWHLAQPDAMSWLELARRAAEGAGLDPGRVEGRPGASFGWAAERPAWSALGSERGLLLPPIDNALERYARQVQEEGGIDCARGAAVTHSDAALGA